MANKVGRQTAISARHPENQLGKTTSREFSVNYQLASIASGVLMAMGSIRFNFLPSLICFVPLFIILETRNSRTCFKAGLISGATISCLSFSWMIQGAQRFTGSSIVYGVVAFVISAALLSLYFACTTFCCSLLRGDSKKKFSFLINGISIACVYVLWEHLLSLFATGMPWFSFYSGSGLVDNLYAIQPAAYIGLPGLSFFLVFINFLIAASIVQKKWLQLLVPGFFAMLYAVTGYLLYHQFNQNRQNGKPFTVAIVTENVAPEIKWDDKTGDQLVKEMFALTAEATKMNADIILWSETAVPWTYRPDDDLVNELLKISSSKKVTHLLGINTAYKKNEVFNSVYSLNPNGQVNGRYDKRFLLAFIEKDVGGITLPFMSGAGFTVEEGESNIPLPTPYGQAGVMICNESSVASSAYEMVDNGAQFLVNVSNDSWFGDTYIAESHFYAARLRAVETRKDVVVNSNMGYSGLIDANGNIVVKQRSDEPLVQKVSVAPNNYRSVAMAMPSLIPYSSFIFVFLLIISSFVSKPKRSLFLSLHLHLDARFCPTQQSLRQEQHLPSNLLVPEQ